jgi:hypothetical protein
VYGLGFEVALKAVKIFADNQIVEIGDQRKETLHHEQ